MPRTSTIELYKENMKFSAGHFTVFSPTSRENLHGHNYQVYAAFTTILEEDGLSFDYRFYKEKMRQICDSLDEFTLIAGRCPHLKISEQSGSCQVEFNQEKMQFPARDVKILPISNITVEELSHWILNQVLADKNELAVNRIQKIKIKVLSGPGQSGSSTWRATDV